MNILIAIDSFKGSLTTTALSDAIEAGITKVSTHHNITKIPIADGGEGTVSTLVDGLNGTTVMINVQDPLFRPLRTNYGILDNETAIIEMAASSGLTLITEDERNPLYTSTIGVGEMIKDAIKRGVRKFIIGIGGSATNDAGIGMLQALGVRFYNAKRQEVEPIGKSLLHIETYDTSNLMEEIQDCEFLIACDVDNPLFGERGAAHVYGKQKGASTEDVIYLDEGLYHFAEVVKRQSNVDLSQYPGTGAAGGLGFGFKVFLDATLQPGVDIIFDMLNMEEKVQATDLIITGEGCLDFQTVMGKAPMGIGKLAKKYGIPVIALAGSVTDDAMKAHDFGITSMFSVVDGPITLQEAMEPSKAKLLVEKKVEELFHLIEAVGIMKQK